MRRQEAQDLVAAMPPAREGWLGQTVAGLRAEAVWLAGSLGRGEGDSWSDVDLLVVAGDLPLGDAILTLEVPRNGPAGGRYVGAMYDIGPLPLWVDWYSWPASLPAPRDARLLSGHGNTGCRTLFESLDHHGRGPGTATDPATFALAMLPLTAKFIARGEHSAAAGMAAMLGITDQAPLVDGLRDLLAATPGNAVVRTRIARVLDVVAALT
ncbi:nucleotidyltransferase domain-containing protein [Actinoplanes sp. NEAU-A12]|uniref:Nucleotidyltransferase domain-containing protein n=1 Tax=Actinoplanes sandaracinus TaxID=3045177 RepID=A0ABT6WZE0_9ACTN|nr:nucleotidyltransferase domain-containing protein [Actinoplanes sandaracinus]MDI6105121.1 nucleotidyltransferase domain-containing protein [Actinoplanes sandaracinus]